ncbi:MAG TPA: DUF805 domain-containing protein [Rhizomicrobium sp.]|jgi:uncharacterized membrane protein YhaH (DUF805 family)
MRPGRFLFGLRGRLPRAGYWIYVAIAAPLFVGLILIYYMYAMSFPGAYENGGPTPWPTGVLGTLGAVVYFAALGSLVYAGLAVAIKRLHDRDKGAGWAVLFLIMPPAILVGLQELIDSGHPLPVPLHYISYALYLWALVELGFLRGDSGANQFGPDPLATDPPTVE